MERIVIRNVGGGTRNPCGCLVLFDNLLRVHQFRGNGESQFENGFVAGRGGFLRQKPDRGVLIDRDGAVIGRNLPEDQGKQSRFTGSVRADQANPIATIDLERGVVKEHPAGKRF